MAQKRKELSTNPKNVRARERRAELRAKKKRRSEAAIKGWVTRTRKLRAKKKRRSEAAIKGWVTRTREKLRRLADSSDGGNQSTVRPTRKTRQVDKAPSLNDRKTLRKSRRKKSNKELIKELEDQDKREVTLNKELAEKEAELKRGREEKELLDAAIAEFDEIARNMFFGEVPVEDRVKRMQMLWPEVDALTVRKGASRRDALMAWVQRNMFDIPEFWHEYRRRKG